jgi:hypothetical protein
MVGEGTQELFGYVPGRDLDEAVPYTTYELKELSEVEQ